MHRSTHGRRALAGLVATAAALSAGGVLPLMRGESGLPDFIARMQDARRHEDTGGVRQRTANDCGPAALAHALRRLGGDAPYPDPESPLRPGPRGCRLEELAREAERRGAITRVRRLEPADLGDVAVPAILHLREGHFVVLEEGGGDGVARIQDPSLGPLEQSVESLIRHWSGWALELDLPERRSR